MVLVLGVLAVLGLVRAAAAQEWTRQVAGEVSFEVPATWGAQAGVPPEQIILMEKPDQPETGAAFGVVREQKFSDLPPGEPLAVEVAGRTGLRYDWQEEGARGFLVLLDLPGPDGRQVALITGAPLDQWDAAAPLFDRILASVAFGAAPAPASDADGQALAFATEVPQAARGAVDSVAASGMQEGAVYRVAMVDLNGDGAEEVLVHVKHSNWCSGWGDKCRTVVLRQAPDGSWVSMGYPYAETVMVLPSATEGWSDLRFDGDVYRFAYDQYVAVQ